MAIYQRGGLAIITAGATALTANLSASSEPTVVIPQRELGSNKVAYWGSDNLYPDKIITAMKKSTAGKRGLAVRQRTHFGAGVMLFKRAYEAEREKITQIDRTTVKEIDEFWKKAKVDRLIRECIVDAEWWSFGFVEFITSVDFKKILSARRLTAAQCRYAVIDPEVGRPEKIFISAHWDEHPTLTDTKKVAEVQLIDPYWSSEETLEYLRKNKIRKFAMPYGYPSVDGSYYPPADWHTAFEAGWIEVASSVAEMKKTLFENQVTVKWHIQIPENYWQAKYKDLWEDWTDDQREQKRGETLKALENVLTGKKNVGKAIQTFFDVDDNGRALPGVKIDEIGASFKEGTLIPDSSAANSEILFAQGVDPSLIGAGIPGGKLGAGSGSDKREAFLILNALLHQDRESILEVLHFVKDYNGWPQDHFFGIENITMTTLDSNPTGQQKTTIA